MWIQKAGNTGDCLFDSYAALCGGTAEKWRLLAVDCLITNGSSADSFGFNVFGGVDAALITGLFCDDGISGYTKRMGRNGEWGTVAELAALACHEAKCIRIWKR
jgi:ketol-acid reductoisomerase